jgi:[ribosomal protein S5]-alanine N-acetyltransferase
VFQDFSTPRLKARRIAASDLNYVVLTDSDPQIHTSIYPVQPSRAESEARLERWLREEREANLGFWIFKLGIDDIGHAGLFRSSRIKGAIELGYVIRPPYWGNGYATEMARGIIETVARAANLGTVLAVTKPHNVASQRVLEKAGFRSLGDQIEADGQPSMRFRLDL